MSPSETAVWNFTPQIWLCEAQSDLHSCDSYQPRPSESGHGEKSDGANRSQAFIIALSLMCNRIPSNTSLNGWIPTLVRSLPHESRQAIPDNNVPTRTLVPSIQDDLLSYMLTVTRSFHLKQ